MKISAVSFGNNNQKTYSHEKAENEALVKLAKYWAETGDLRPARIDFFSGDEPKITLVGKPPKPHVENSSMFTKFKNFLKNIIKKSVR